VQQRHPKPGARARKVSDEFTVPLCRGHHREVHRCGDEAKWWNAARIDPTVTARALWLTTHPLPATLDTSAISNAGKRADATELLPRFDPQTEEPAADPSLHLAQCFLRLANLPNYALDRLSRYEFALWRQVAQILFALDNLNRRRPQERKRSHFTSRRDESSPYAPDDD
jgi:hypothetical protein